MTAASVKPQIGFAPELPQCRIYDMLVYTQERRLLAFQRDLGHGGPVFLSAAGIWFGSRECMDLNVKRHGVTVGLTPAGSAWLFENEVMR